MLRRACAVVTIAALALAGCSSPDKPGRARGAATPVATTPIITFAPVEPALLGPLRGLGRYVGAEANYQVVVEPPPPEFVPPVLTGKTVFVDIAC